MASPTQPNNTNGQPLYPEGAALKQQIDQRHKKGQLWRVLFLSALAVAILTLVTLLFTIINDSFGYVVVVNKVDPERLVLNVETSKLLSAVNTVNSKDDTALADGIANDPNGVGFFGYAYYQENQDRLKVVAVDGVRPSPETAVSGEYPLTRALYLYTSADVLANNQAADIFLNYLLTHIHDEVEQVGYLPPNANAFAASQQNWLAANPDLPVSPGQWPAVSPEGINGRFTIAGSSTVYPITEHMLNQFAADGYAGTAQNNISGSSAGIQAFCAGQADIAAASRPIKSGEFEQCRENGRFALEFQIGLDTLAVVVNPANPADNLTQAQLQQLFTTAESWADVNPKWPAQPITRYIPDSASGTLDFFIERIFNITLADLSHDELVQILGQNITSGRGRTLEREQRFYQNALVFEKPALWNEVCSAPAGERPSGCTAPPRSQENIHDLVMREVVQPDVVQVYKLSTSLLNRRQIAQEMAASYPNGKLEFRSWLTTDFITDAQSSTPEFAGVRTAILGSLWVIAITVLFSFPIGVGAAIYLEEYAVDNRLNRLLQTNINNLAGVPSIIYGMLGLAVFVRALEVFTSGALFGTVESTASANGRTILSAGLTLGLLILPIIIINAQEALRAVPVSMRQAGLALGATQWQTIWSHVLPSALPGILTGTILAVSRALGETAPLVVVGASTFIAVDPTSPFSKFTTLPIQIYQWTSRPQAEFRNIAAAAIIVLLVLLLSLNAAAILLRNRFARRA
jgi:phosphate transport system permease protein